MAGSVTESEADYFVDPANGARSNSGTSLSDPLDSVFAFDNDESFSLSPGDTLALVDSGVDTIPGQCTFFDYGDNASSKITVGTLDSNSGDFIIEVSGSQENGLWMSSVENLDWLGVRNSRIHVRSVDNNAFVWTNGDGPTNSMNSTVEWVKCSDYGNNTPNRTGNGLWFASGIFGMTARDVLCTDGSAEADSDGFYIGAADPFSGDHLLERCTASYNADDGFDLFQTDPNYPSVLVDCIAHHNGRDLATWQSGNEDGTQGSWGDGNGFKLGGDNGAFNYAYRCLAYLNKGRNMGGDGDPNGSGFDDNGLDGNKYYNNTAFDNEEWGFRPAGGDTILVNNLGFQNGDGDIRPTGDRADENNTWNLGSVSLSSADFVSLNEDDNGFLVPATDSELVDAGVVVDGYTVTSGNYSSKTIDLTNDPPYAITETFDGNSPDLGYIEETGQSSGGGGGGGGSGVLGALTFTALGANRFDANSAKIFD